MNLLCLFGHKWPSASEMPIVPADELMVIHCKRCGKRRWLVELVEEALTIPRR